MNVFDQGTIIHGIRSDKYPSNRCFGIVITASCDIANCKVSKFYYLVAIDVKDWIISDIGFREIFNQFIIQTEKNISDAVQKNQLDWKSLKSFSVEEAIQVINANCKNPSEVIKQYKNYAKYNKQALTIEEKKQTAKEKQKSIISYLQRISKGEILHFYFLPQNAYVKGGKRDKGLIVDLQEIETISLRDAELIKKKGIDFLELPRDQMEKERLQKSYWLNTCDDFVIISDTISSPWREHLMQRFSHGFIRIGVDGATEDDFKRIATYE